MDAVRLAEEQLKLVDTLRRYGAAHASLMRAFADNFSLHPTDATALSEILFAEDLGEPLVPALLAQRIGRSRPATTAVLARLEAANLIKRGPHCSDGRSKILLGGDQIGEAIPRFFRPLSEALAARLAAHDADKLAGLILLLQETIDCVINHTAR